MNDEFRHDVFLSHNQTGDIIALKVDEGLEQSQQQLLPFSLAALASGGVVLERALQPTTSRPIRVAVSYRTNWDTVIFWIRSGATSMWASGRSTERRFVEVLTARLSETRAMTRSPYLPIQYEVRTSKTLNLHRNWVL